MLFLIPVWFQARIKNIFSVISQIVYPKVLSEVILQNFPLLNILWHPVIFHHHYLSSIQFIFRNHLHISCHMLCHQTSQDSGHNHYRALRQRIFWYHSQVSVNILLHHQRHQNRLAKLFPKQPVTIHMIWPVLSSSALQRYIVSRHWSILIQIRLHFESTCQKIIQVNVHLWCQIKAQIFGQHISQVPNHQILNHWTIMSFWPKLLVDIHVNIQKWPKVLSHLFQPSDIPYHIISGGCFTNSNLLQAQTQKHITILYSSNISCWYFIF